MQLSVEDLGHQMVSDGDEISVGRRPALPIGLTHAARIACGMSPGILVTSAPRAGRLSER
jgi:hypothetical protein